LALVFVIPGTGSNICLLYLKKKHDRATKLEQRKLQLAMEADAALKKTQVFGVDLKEIVARDGTDVPIIIIICMQWLKTTTGDIEGLFRVAPSSNDLVARTKEIDKTGKVDLTGVLDPHLTTGLIKVRNFLLLLFADD